MNKPRNHCVKFGFR